jgi:hypothetical protein
VHVEAIAFEALTSGRAEQASRSDFAPGEAKALAIDFHDDVAAVLVVRRRRDDAWIIDVVPFMHDGDTWTDLGSGGGTCGDLPIDPDLDAEPALGPFTSGCSVSAEDGIAYAGGFVIGRIAAVEFECADRMRRVPITDGSGAFVVVVGARDDDLAYDVRALDAAGNVVESTRDQERERQATEPGVSVSEAISLSDGTVTMVRGVLINLPGEPPVLCDEVDHGERPRPRGPHLRIESDREFPQTKVFDGGTSLVMIVISGVVSGGVLRTQ